MTPILRSVSSAGFSAGTKWLKSLEPGEIGALITAASDVALVIDKGGIIRDAAVCAEGLAREDIERWLGRPWIDTVTVESKPKVKDLLTGAPNRPKFREINHPSRHGLDLPIRYSATRISKGENTIALGRDLRTVSHLQQRLVEAQQAMEREYARVRLAETRYRMLFNLGAEPVVIVDGTTLRIVEANPAAQKIIGGASGLPVGASLPGFFDAESNEALETLLKTARMAGRAGEVELRATASPHPLNASASLYRQDEKPYLLVRLSSRAPADSNDGLSGHVVNLLQHLPDGFVVIAPDYRILEANRAFLDLVELPGKDQVIGQDISQWLGRPGIDLPLLMSNIGEHGSVRAFATFIQGVYGAVEDVEISAVPAMGPDTMCFGLVIRPVGARVSLERRGGNGFPNSVERMSELVGRVTLKELVRESTDVIEKLCIEAALDLSKDNRASAAQMLGLSRQGFLRKASPAQSRRPRRRGLNSTEKCQARLTPSVVLP